MGLILQFFRPTLFNALVYPINLQRSQGMHTGDCTDLGYRLGGIEAPASIDV